MACINWVFQYVIYIFAIAKKQIYILKRLIYVLLCDFTKITSEQGSVQNFKILSFFFLIVYSRYCMKK